MIESGEFTLILSSEAEQRWEGALRAGTGGVGLLVGLDLERHPAGVLVE